mmetsp:Transcript_95023/g.297170  ORF Transcript_95023/g.297170 Transcript_95023/m.297170 type:complete len:415 (-) Transcript_95023:292-1536(-)
MHPSHVSAALLLLFLRPHACAAVGGPEPSSAPGPVEGAEGEEECSFADTRLLQVSHSLAGSALENVTSAQAGNLCIEGKQVPELYLLGEPKAASTSVAQAFEDVGAVAAVQSDYAERPWWHQLPPNRRLSPRGHLVADKERHFFDDWLELYKPTDPRLLPDFLSQLPACAEDRKVAADCTPSNLHMTPMPFGAKSTGFAYGDLCGPDLPYTNLPWMLHRLYGRSSSRLAFVINLREPLHRMQSAWYHAMQISFLSVCRDCKALSFVEALTATLDRFEQTPRKYDDWLWHSMPSLQLPWWHSEFDARQLFVLGTHEYGRSGFRPLCEALEPFLGVDWDCEATRENTHANTHSHPPLSEEPISAALERQFNRTFEPDTHRLVKELASLQSQGATLIGYQGAAGSVRDVEAWLRQAW